MLGLKKFAYEIEFAIFFFNRFSMVTCRVTASPHFHFLSISTVPKMVSTKFLFLHLIKLNRSNCIMNLIWI